MQGVLWNYLRRKSFYHCPDEPDYPLRRSVSYDINAHLNGWSDPANPPAPGFGLEYLTRRSSIRDASRTLVFIDHSETGVSMGIVSNVNAEDIGFNISRKFF